MLTLKKKKLLPIILLFIPCLAFSQIPTDRSMDTIVLGYINAAATWESSIATSASRLFALLAALDVVFMGLMMVLKKSDFQDIIGELVKRMLIIGFFLILLTNGSAWTTIIVESFRELASTASGISSIAPSNVMDNGIRIAVNLINSQSGWDLAAKTVAGLIGLGILVIFALLTAELVVVLISTYILLTAGVIMLAFGGSRWTQQFAINYYKTALALGVRLFIIQLLIGLGVTLINGFVAQISNTASFEEMFVVFASVLVLYVLVKSISTLVQSLISGSGDTSIGGTGALVGAAVGAGTTAAAVGAAGAGAAKSVAGTGAAVSSASALASQAAGGSESGMSKAFSSAGGAMGGSSGAAMGAALGSGLSKVAGTVSELTKAGVADYGSKVKGEVGAESGTMGGRMSARMNDKAELKEMSDSGSSEQTNNYISGVPETNG